MKRLLSNRIVLSFLAAASAAALYAQTSPIGVNPASLSFQYALGSSAGPAVQTINLTVPAGTTFRVDRSTANGANWLLIATSGNPPNAVLAQIDTSVAQTLTAGTYNGAITVTPTSGSNTTAATVPVTLTVTQAPQITAAPQSLSFVYQIGGTNNQTQQTIHLTGGSQAVSFAFTSDPWITANPPSGTVPANGGVDVTVQVAPPSQNPGVSNGTLTLNTTGTPQKIPVQLTVSNNPLLNLPAAPVAFTYSIGGTVPAPAQVNVTSTGTPLAFNVSATTAAGGPWLVVPTTGITGTPIPVSIDPTKLAPGTYTGTVTLTPTSGGGPAQQFSVTVTVTNDPSLVTNASSLSFVYQTNQQLPPAQTLRLTSSTGVPLSYTATTSTPWLTLVGHTSGTTDDSFTVSANPAGVATGATIGQISIAVANAATGASLGTVTVPVTLYVSNNALLSVTPSQPVVFTIPAGGQSSQPVDVALASTSPTDQLSLTVGTPTTTSGGQWLLVSNTPAATPGTLRLIASPQSSLAPGVYTGSVSVTASGSAGAAVNSPVTIPVVLQLTSGTISATPASLSFEQTSAGTAPAPQTVNVASGGAALTFFVTAYDGGLGWLSATAATGSTPAVVSVSVDGSRLSPGTYQGRVIVSSTFASGSPISIPVTFKVDAGTVTAPATPLVFTIAQGSTAASTQNVSVTGTAGLTFSTAATSTGNWLSVAPPSGTVPATVQVTANAGTLAVNSYTGSVTITPATGAGSPITIPVTLNVVQATAKPIIQSVQNAASYFAASLSPGENVVLFGTGLGPDPAVKGVLASNGTVATTLSDTQVFFDGIPAPIIYVWGPQTSVMVPYEIAGRATTSVRVVYKGVQSDPVTYNVSAVAPGIYTQNFQGSGPGVILNPDGRTLNGPNAPAGKGSVISLYMTGEGITNPPSATGALIPSDGTGLKHPQASYTATVGGIPATVIYAGSAPGIVAGISQVNVQIPANAPSGAVPIVLSYGVPGGTVLSTRSDVTIQVQ